MTIVKKCILPSLIVLSLIIICIGFGLINCHKAPSKPEMELETATEVTADSLKKPSGTLLSLNKPVVASSEEGSLLAVNAVDGNQSTRWSSVWSDPQWIYIDLGTTYTITGIELNWEAAYGKTYQIQVSDNATAWTTIFAESNGNGGIDEITGLNGSGRYVRMYGTARGTSYGYSLWEFEVYGPTYGSSMEAEDMTLTNYVVNNNTAASGGELIKLSASGVTGHATYNFSDSTGTYDIEVWYWDENDGECTFRIYVGGIMVDEWVADQNLGSADPVAQTRTSRTKSGVSISTGAQIKLEAVQNNQEWGRFDLVALTASGGPGNQPPTVSITSPSDGATFTEGDNITINANASDSDGSVILVEFFQGSTKLGEDATSPYSYTWSNVAAGSYSLTARATDNGGATTTSTAVNITVNEAPPSGSSMEAEDMTLTDYLVNSNSSASGGNLIKLSASGVTGNATYNFSGTTGTYDVKAWYYDENDGACTFRIYVGGTMVDEWVADQNLGSADPVAQTRTSRTKTGVSISTGAQITLEAVQNNQEWGRFDLVELTASGGPGNQAPAVSITSPSDGATFTEGDNITINADASDSDGSVTLVEFFQGSTKLGEDASSPYSYTWSNVSAGNYSLTARATDNEGATVTSSAVNITVNVAPGGFPVDLQGTTPEEKTVNVNATKPADATDATLEMVVYDPDQANEGALYINGDVNSITLFGSQGTSANDGATVTVTYNTPASWWSDGANSLRFTHTSTAGYRVESASVTFTTAPPPGDFPVDLQGTTPEEATVSLNVVKEPADATDATLSMVVYDPDQTNEGTLYINGDVNTITLFGSQGVSGNDQQTVTVSYNTPASWWVDGANSLRFTHTSTGGYRVESASLSFSSGPPPGNWVLTWSDEFNGTGVPDPAKWDRPEYNRRPNSSGPDGWWEQDDSYLEGGNLVIRIRRVADRNGDGDPHDYNVGAIRTYGKFTQTYGKFECRAQLPTKQGWWVAFWMMQGNQGSVGNGGVDGSEVDIMEGWGWTDKINHAIHWDGYGSAHQSVGHSEYISGIRDGFHTFTLEWHPDIYIFLIDGVEQWRSTGGGVCNQPGYIKITGECSTESWAITDSWARTPEGVSYPDYFLVDWVRVYEYVP